MAAYDDLVSVARVLWAVEQIPPGRIATYGDIGRAVGVSPRRVGWIMARHGSGVAWWWVVARDGRLPEHLVAVAGEHWDAEGIAWRDGRCAVESHRVAPGWFAPEP